MNKKKKRKGNIYLSGGLVNAISGGANLLGTISSNLNPETPNVTPEASNTQASTNDSLMNDWEAWNPMKHYTKKDFGTRNSDVVGGAIGGVAQGALSGASIGGPIGGIVGGALGGISSIFGSNKKKKALREANRKVDEANQRSINNFNNKADNIATETNWNNLANYAALGGILPITNSVERHLASFGNNIFAYGGQFSNGVTSFNTGGTHEENPHGGILQGVGENGEPNLVEEGELKWNDYIFSNRLVVPNTVSEVNLPKELAGKTYAEAAEILQKESLEREVDPISKAGLNMNLSRLAMSQEQERESKNTNNSFEQGGLLNNVYAEGGSMNNKKSYTDDDIMNYLKQKFGDKWEKALEIVSLEGGYKNGKFITNQRQVNKMKSGKTNTDRGIFQISNVFHPNVSDEDADDPFKAIDYSYNLSKQGTDWSPWVSAKKASFNKSKEVEQTPEIPSVANTPFVPKPIESNPFTVNAPTTSTIINNNINKAQETLPEIAPITPSVNNNTGLNLDSDMLRYSPILTNAGLTLSNIFSKPEKIQLNRANERVGAGKLGNYMKYNPMDFEYLANKIKQQGASTRRAISNNSAGNRATATAGILASDYNLNNALGDTYTKVQDLNNQRRNVVEEFNRGTNMFNIQNDMQAQLANQRNTLLNTEIANKETLLNSQANANRRNSIREGIATVGTQLGQLGTENRWMKIAPKIFGGYDSLGNFNKKAFGGILPKIYKKKIK